jgi:hypothetical protein
MMLDVAVALKHVQVLTHALLGNAELRRQLVGVHSASRA